MSGRGAKIDFQETLNFSITARLTKDLSGFAEEYDNNYIRLFSSVISLSRENVDTGKHTEKRIGYIEFWIIDGARALNNGLDIADICDAQDQESIDYAADLYDGGLLREFDSRYPINNDTLVLHRVEIRKEFRGKGYGIEAAKQIIEIFGSRCGAVVLHVAPLQFSPIAEDEDWQKQYDTSCFTRDRELATRRVMNHWKQLGLRKMRGKNYLYRINE